MNTLSAHSGADFEAARLAPRNGEQPHGDDRVTDAREEEQSLAKTVEAAEAVVMGGARNGAMAAEAPPREGSARVTFV